MCNHLGRKQSQRTGGGVIAASLAIWLLLANTYFPRVAWAQEELFVANEGAHSITVYPRTASGNTAPLRTLQGLVNPHDLAVDLVHDELVIADSAIGVLVFARTASGSTAPLRTLPIPGTASSFVSGLALDLVHDELLVVNFTAKSITVYPRTASGNTPPVRTLSGPATGMSGPGRLAVDLVHDELLVTNSTNNSIAVYRRTASGNIAPLRTLQGSATGLSGPFTLAVDLLHDEVLVANTGCCAGSSITVYFRTASGNVPPLRTLQGPLMGFSNPNGLAVDLTHDELVVADGVSPSPSIVVHARTASGNSVPLRILRGPATGLQFPRSLAVTTGTGADAFITRLYQQVLGRDPEAGGVAAWVQHIAEDGSVVPTVLAFFHSSEFLARNTTNEQFLTVLYHTFLNREPDPSGFNAFLADLQTGLRTRDNLLDIFIDSQEFAAQASFLPPLPHLREFVSNLYVRILGRGPDQGGLQSFTAALQQSCTTSTVVSTIRNFLASSEFQARQTTNNEFVTILYRVFLDRVPDTGGLAGWVALLNQGTANRDQLLGQFAASPEFQAILQSLCS